MKYTLKKRLKRCLIQVYHTLGVDKLLMNSGYFDKRIDKAINKLGQESNLSREDLKSDIKRCYRKYLTTPEEYFLFGFEGKGHDYRSSFLSDNLRIRTLISLTGEKKFVEELSDKFQFYLLTKKYFGRDAIVVGNEEDSDFKQFQDFINRHRTLFVKPLSSSFGKGAHIINISDNDNVKQMYFNYLNHGKWILGDKIVQSKEMEVWNDTSINTVRLPCFYNQGVFHVLNPYMRTGRKGSVVDNGGAGGVFVCIDEKTGVVISDGKDEDNNFYEFHPDSGIRYKGWAVPKWNDLLILAERVLKECLPGHKYVGFDFALTDKGWVLIEGNWGQFLGQYANHEGVKDKFMQYLKGKY